MKKKIKHNVSINRIKGDWTKHHVKTQIGFSKGRKLYAAHQKTSKWRRPTGWRNIWNSFTVDKSGKCLQTVSKQAINLIWN